MEQLIKSIYDRPMDWKITRHTFSHSGGFRLWVANGFLCARAHESGMSMTFKQKWKIWKAYKWWCSNAPIECVK